MIVTPHIVVRDASRAADWYKRALGARSAAACRFPAAR